MPALLVMAVLSAEPSKPDDVPRAIIDDLVAGRADAAHARLGPTAAALPSQTLLGAWKQATTDLGAIGRVERVSTSEQKGLVVFVHAVHFAKGALQVTTAVDPKTLKAEGFWLKPLADQKSADYVKADTFSESTLTLGKEPWAVGATLTLPKGKGPFPAVVLVHGSGPHDRDETIGANKPFRDLAEGLGSRGVAVLRYDKRTLVHGKEMIGGATEGSGDAGGPPRSGTGIVKLDDEVVLDALAAVELLATRPEVDPKRIWVVGHSLGAQLAPEIASRSDKVKGAVLLAPPARKPCEAIIAQLEHVGSSQAMLDEVKRQCAAMQAGTATGTLLGAPVEYWQELASKDAIAVARKLGKPLLVLHGDRDYQVDASDAAAWKKALGKTKGVELVNVPRANHLFIEGDGVSKPSEYGKPGHVAQSVIERIAGFTNR